MGKMRTRSWVLRMENEKVFENILVENKKRMGQRNQILRKQQREIFSEGDKAWQEFKY